MKTAELLRLSKSGTQKHIRVIMKKKTQSSNNDNKTNRTQRLYSQQQDQFAEFGQLSQQRIFGFFHAITWCRIWLHNFNLSATFKANIRSLIFYISLSIKALHNCASQHNCLYNLPDLSNLPLREKRVLPPARTASFGRTAF